MKSPIRRRQNVTELNRKLWKSTLFLGLSKADYDRLDKIQGIVKIINLYAWKDVGILKRPEMFPTMTAMIRRIKRKLAKLGLPTECDHRGLIVFMIDLAEDEGASEGFKQGVAYAQQHNRVYKIRRSHPARRTRHLH